MPITGPDSKPLNLISKTITTAANAVAHHSTLLGTSPNRSFIASIKTANNSTQSLTSTRTSQADATSNRIERQSNYFLKSINNDDETEVEQPLTPNSDHPSASLRLAPALVSTKSGIKIDMNKVATHFAGSNLFHGSRSASLLAFTNFSEEKGALIPTGQLLKDGKVPFSGTDEAFISMSSFNKNTLSSVTINDFKDAFDFSHYHNNQTWDYKRAKDQLGFAQEFVKSYEKEGCKPWRTYPHPKASNKENYWGQVYTKAHSALLAQKTRIQQWEKMPPEQRSLVTDNFPVIYGLHISEDSKRRIPIRSGYNEIGILNGASPSEIHTIMVYRKHIPRVQELLKTIPQARHIQIKAIDDIVSS